MTENSQDMELRLKTADEELNRAPEFAYRVVNRDGILTQAVAEIDAIITAEKCRTQPRRVELI